MILHWFVNFGQIHDYLVYGVIIILSFVEGPILAFLCGILFRVGVFADAERLPGHASAAQARDRRG